MHSPHSPRPLTAPPAGSSLNIHGYSLWLLKWRRTLRLTSLLSKPKRCQHRNVCCERTWKDGTKRKRCTFPKTLSFICIRSAGLFWGFGGFFFFLSSIQTFGDYPTGLKLLTACNLNWHPEWVLKLGDGRGNTGNAASLSALSAFPWSGSDERGRSCGCKVRRNPRRSLTLKASWKEPAAPALHSLGQLNNSHRAKPRMARPQMIYFCVPQRLWERPPFSWQRCGQPSLHYVASALCIPEAGQRSQRDERPGAGWAGSESEANVDVSGSRIGQIKIKKKVHKVLKSSVCWA